MVAVAVVTSCGDSASGPTPQPTPTPLRETWYAFVVQCANCPGLTNPEIDRTLTPYRARLRVGQLTSLRATARDRCEVRPSVPQIVRWIVGDPLVLKVEPSSNESAIVTALASGLARVTAERRLPDGSLDPLSLKDSLVTSGCGPLPEIVFEVVP